MGHLLMKAAFDDSEPGESKSQYYQGLTLPGQLRVHAEGRKQTFVILILNGRKTRRWALIILNTRDGDW